MIESKCVIVKKQFTNDKGDNVVYYEYYIELDGKKIRLYPTSEDKKLANYILSQIF